MPDRHQCRHYRAFARGIGAIDFSEQLNEPFVETRRGRSRTLSVPWKPGQGGGLSRKGDLVGERLLTRLKLHFAERLVNPPIDAPVVERGRKQLSSGCVPLLGTGVVCAAHFSSINQETSSKVNFRRRGVEGDSVACRRTAA